VYREHGGPKTQIPTSSKTADIDADNGPDQRNVMDQQTATNSTPDIEKEERLTQLVEGILDSNPGMNVTAARSLAQATLVKFPSLVS
jgi:hypothetical protein